VEGDVPRKHPSSQRRRHCLDELIRMSEALPDFVQAYVVGHMIAQLRKRHNIGQQSLADSAGIGQATMSRIERGQASPRHHVFRRMAIEFGLEASELTQLIEQANKNTSRATAWALTVDVAFSWDELARVVGPTGISGLVLFAVCVTLHESLSACSTESTTAPRQ